MPKGFEDFKVTKSGATPASDGGSRQLIIDALAFPSLSAALHFCL
jgi:hypothetical protein